ncbi:MarR family transcriptional regulator [Roseiarcus sp.]|jgi:MarR family transcriptional regulator for hemolysin|uniref:MarR family transcriptional regulator n=1 Tax=Roseiarcus sp. TaxID=1969460 RepID=UPI003D138293
MTSQNEYRAGFGARVTQTARLWRRAVDHRLQPFGLTEATWLPLLRLARAAVPLRQKDLADSLSLDGSSVVRLLDVLQSAGLISRREEDSDRRAKAIFLTPLGLATVQKVETVAQKVRDDALAGLSDYEIETASRVLAHICRALASSSEERAA